MKHLSVLLILVFFSLSLSGQEVQETSKNMIGLSYLYSDYGYDYTDDDHSYHIDYRRKVSNTLELRSSIKLGGDDGLFFNSLRLGFSEIVWNNEKLNVYLGADLEIARIRNTYLFDCITIDGCYITEYPVSLHSFAGIEYNPTTRLGIRLEQRLVSATYHEQSGWYRNESDFTTQILNGTSVGMHYRF